MSSIAFATDSKHSDLTPDDRLAAEHLARHGHRVTPAVWDDGGVDWERFDAIVIRSCWDYHLRLEEFHGWLDRLEELGRGTLNPISMVRWNSRKTYLEELRGAAFDVVPTIYLPRGSTADIDDLMVRLGRDDPDARLQRDELVVKPTVGASAHGLWIAGRDPAADPARLEAALAADELMVQPLLHEIVDRGEWSLIYFGGAFSHAVNKRPARGDIRVQEELGGQIVAMEPPEPVRAAADRLLTWSARKFDSVPLFTRVDLVESGGEALLMELELVEPWLYFHVEPESPERFRSALDRLNVK